MLGNGACVTMLSCQKVAPHEPSSSLLSRLHMVRLMLLERLLQTLPQLRNVGGVRAIPYMQVCMSDPPRHLFDACHVQLLELSPACRSLLCFVLFFWGRFSKARSGFSPSFVAARSGAVGLLRG